MIGGVLLEKKMEKKIFWNLSDNSDLSKLTLANLNEINEYILNDIGNVQTEDRENVVYTIQPVLMTQDDFDNLPEYQF